MFSDGIEIKPWGKLSSSIISREIRPSQMDKVHFSQTLPSARWDLEYQEKFWDRQSIRTDGKSKLCVKETNETFQRLFSSPSKTAKNFLY